MAGMKTLTPDQFRAELRKRIDATFGGSQARAAEVWKVDRGNEAAEEACDLVRRAQAAVQGAVRGYRPRTPDLGACA